ncbi:MAG: hypothetical protein H6740_27090 [Alphaproteobacteria bacterium]|nr:hypothetical protein [Alphaproteobacteria bacterium]
MPLLILSLLACAGKDASDDSAQALSDVSYHGDVRPLLEKHCTRCHEEGGLGVGDFTDEAHVTAFADRMLARAEAGTMPPTVSDPECHDFAGSDQMTLDDAELGVLQAWVEGGLEMGSPADYSAPEIVEPALVDADMELMMQAAYSPSWWDEGNPGNEYRCFVLDPGEPEDFFITAMHPVIEQASIAHHAVLFLAPRRDLDERWTGDAGYDCIGGGGPEDGIIAAWAPGMVPVEFGEGYGLRVSSDEVLILQMHYFRSSADADGLQDLSGYALRTAPSVDKEIFLAPLGIFDFAIPAGAESYTDADSFPNNYYNLNIHGVFPHMHRLGTSYSMTLEDEDGDETCVVAGDYDFDNQLFYMFEEPIEFDVGTTAHYECTWDNSAENPDRVTETPVTTHYGERTDEEMCYFFTYVSGG